jgi:hypothetical protein
MDDDALDATATPMPLVRYQGPAFGLRLILATALTKGRTIAVLLILCNILGAGLGPQPAGFISDLLHSGGNVRPSHHALPGLPVWLSSLASGSTSSLEQRADRSWCSGAIGLGDHLTALRAARMRSISLTAMLATQSCFGTR